MFVGRKQFLHSANTVNQGVWNKWYTYSSFAHPAPKDSRPCRHRDVPVRCSAGSRSAPRRCACTRDNWARPTGPRSRRGRHTASRAGYNVARRIGTPWDKLLTILTYIIVEIITKIREQWEYIDLSDKETWKCLRKINESISTYNI